MAATGTTPADLDIRPAEAGDVDIVERLTEAAYRRYVARLGRTPAPMEADHAALIAGGSVHLAQYAGRTAGLIVLIGREDHILVESVCVDPALEGRGIGRRLMQFAEDRAYSRGTPAIELYTNAKMTENIALYRRAGFRIVDRPNPTAFERVYFRKDLADRAMNQQTPVQPFVSIQAEAFDVAAEIDRLTERSQNVGGIVTFTGHCRDEDGRLAALELEHYPGMAEAEIGRIAGLAVERWPLYGVRVVHRHGRILPGEAIVLVAAASRHRRAAFEAAEFVMDFLKTRAPFWKKEHRTDGSEGEWVDARDVDDAALARWGLDI